MNASLNGRFKVGPRVVAEHLLVDRRKVGSRRIRLLVGPAAQDAVGAASVVAAKVARQALVDARRHAAIVRNRDIVHNVVHGAAGLRATKVHEYTGAVLKVGAGTSRPLGRVSEMVEHRQRHADVVRPEAAQHVLVAESEHAVPVDEHAVLVRFFLGEVLGVQLHELLVVALLHGQRHGRDVTRLLGVAIEIPGLAHALAGAGCPGRDRLGLHLRKRQRQTEERQERERQALEVATGLRDHRGSRRGASSACCLTADPGMDCNILATLIQNLSLQESL